MLHVIRTLIALKSPAELGNILAESLVVKLDDPLVVLFHLISVDLYGFHNRTQRQEEHTPHSKKVESQQQTYV